MTTLLTRPEATGPGGMPGWDIVADMTPPELVNFRWIAVLRRRIALGLLLVLALCGAGYLYATLQQSSAMDEAERTAGRTSYLTRAADQYVGITRIETTVSGLDAQVATVMKNDVDVASVVTSIQRALPKSMSIQTISLNLNSDGVSEAGTGLDTSGRPTIGTVQVSGSGTSLDDLPAFVDGLSAVRGFAAVLPTSNQVSSGAAQFNVAVSLDDRLYSHQFDVKDSR